MPLRVVHRTQQPRRTLRLSALVNQHQRRAGERLLTDNATLQPMILGSSPQDLGPISPRRRLSLRHAVSQLRQERGQFATDVLGEAVKDRVAVTHQRAQYRDQRGIWQLALAQGNAIAAQDPNAPRAGPRRELGNQTRLPNARVAGNKHEPTVTSRRGRERQLELSQLS
jgi:hypothetical protein